MVDAEDTDEQDHGEAEGVVDNEPDELVRARLSPVGIHVEPIQYAAADHDKMVEACDVDVEQEADEVCVIVVADTVGDPRTVVVHAQHAALARLAVVGSRRFVS